MGEKRANVRVVSLRNLQNFCSCVLCLGNMACVKRKTNNRLICNLCPSLVLISSSITDVSDFFVFSLQILVEKFPQAT